MSKVVTFNRTGGPEVLEIVDMEVPAPAAGDHYRHYASDGSAADAWPGQRAEADLSADPVAQYRHRRRRAAA